MTERLPLRVLVVDDERNIRQTLAICLEGFGCTVEQVATGAAAVDALRREPFDVAFCDLKLGGESGLDLLPRLLAERPGLDVVIITAGRPRQAGMTREDLLAVNLDIITKVAAGVKEHAPKALCIIVTNPLDAMVYAFYKLTGFPKNQVIGMAGTLDTARWRAFVAMELGVSVSDVAGTVLGGHAPDMVPLPRLTTVGGVPLTDLATKEQIDRLATRTREAGTEIVKLFGKGSAFFSPAYSAIVIAESYLKDKRRILPCAALCEGEYGVNGLFIGVPVMVSAKGMEKVFEIKLNDDEKAMLQKTIGVVQKTVEETKL